MTGSYKFPKLRVLAVDDYIVNQQVIGALLKNLGCEVVDIATDGSQTLELYQNNDYHIIFMDIQMPDMNGYEVADIIKQLQKKEGKNIPIVAITADSSEADRQKCLKHMDDYIAKPVMPEKIEKILKKYFSDHIQSFETPSLKSGSNR